jgi:hypothetical protein
VFGYEGDKTVKLVQSGPGGLEDFRSLLTDDDIFYVVYSLEVKDQDEVTTLPPPQTLHLCASLASLYPTASPC